MSRAGYIDAVTVLERFTNDMCVFGMQERVAKADLSEALAAYCAQHDYDVPEEHTVREVLMDCLFIGSGSQRLDCACEAVPVWRGIKLREGSP